MGKEFGRPFDRFSVNSIEEMDAEILYHRKSLSKIKLARGRYLSEALVNDPDAPCGVTYSGLVYYHRDEIAMYVKAVNEGAGVVEAPNPLQFPERRPHSDSTGIYFLKRDGKITYVGQARNVLTRVMYHKTEKRFDAVDFFPCLECDLDDLEGLFIRLLGPEDNGRPYAFARPNLSAPKSELWSRIVPIHGIRSCMQ